MIAYLRGKIIFLSNALKKSANITLDVNGVGYSIVVSGKNLEKYKKEATAEIHIYHHIWQDGQELYGFSDQDELNFFKLLIEIQGIGPKSALGILDKAEIQDIQNAVLSDSSETLEKVSGLGKKTAERIVSGLKDKMQEVRDSTSETRSQGADFEVIDALVSLGFPPDQSRKLLSQVSRELSAEEKIKEVLKILGKK